MSNEGRRWFEQRKDFVGTPRDVTAVNKDETPDLWTRCDGCGDMLYNDALAANGQVCPAAITTSGSALWTGCDCW